MLPESLHVRTQVPRGVFFETGVGTTPPAAALVEQYDPVVVRIEETSRASVTASARAAVDKERGLPVGIAAFLKIDLVLSGHPEVTVVERLYFRIEIATWFLRCRCRHLSGTV